MLNELKFVQGAVSKKDMIPEMTHFCIENGQVRAWNGIVAIGSPIQCDLRVKPKAGPMVQAISRCDDTISLSITPANRLSIKSGKFKAFVECINEEFHFPRPEGLATALGSDTLLTAFNTLRPFLGSRTGPHKWASGILLRGRSAFATNGKILAEYWIGSKFPIEVVIPPEAVAEIVRVKECPSHLQLAESSITFQYGGNKWIRTALLAEKWPASLEAMLDHKSCGTVAIPDDLYEKIRIVKPFSEDGTFIIDNGNIRTHLDFNEGASLDYNFSPGIYKFDIDDFLKMEGVATRIEFGKDRKHYFYGEVVRGVIASRDPYL